MPAVEDKAVLMRLCQPQELTILATQIRQFQAKEPPFQTSKLRNKKNLIATKDPSEDSQPRTPTRLEAPKIT